MSKKFRTALLLAYTFPPANSTSWRCFHLYISLRKYFENTHVISTKNNQDSINESPPEASHQHIHRVFTLDYRTFRLRKSKGEITLKESKKSNLLFKLHNVLNSFPLNLILGEGGLLYSLNSLRVALNIVKKDEQILVISSFRPYADHLTAYLLKRLRTKITWVADFRDLHLDPRLNETFFPKFQAWCNRKILAKADIVTTVSKGLAEHLKPFHSNVVVLRNGIGELRSTGIGQSLVGKAANSFTITYTGSMFRDLRKPDMMLEALAELIAEQKINIANVRINYAGKDTATWIPILERYGLVDIFHSMGNIAHDQAIELQSTAHINLLLTYASPELKGNATGKLYEYLAVKRPILLLVNGCQDEELDEIFEETGAGLIAYSSLNHTSLVKEFILEKYSEWQVTGDVAPTILPTALDKFRWENMLQDFLQNNFINKSQVATPNV